MSTETAGSKQVEVTILGQRYMFSCRPSEEGALQAAAAHLDREMCSIRDIGRIKARDRIAILAALNATHALLALQQAQAAASPPPPATPSPVLESAADASDGMLSVPAWRLQGLISKIERALATDNQLL
jgi:cell division protein ZapA